MPFCPKCGSEYREGFTICADCDRELVAERPAITEDEQDALDHGAAVRNADDPTVVIFEAQDEVAASAIRALLEEAGIPVGEIANRSMAAWARMPMIPEGFTYSRLLTIQSRADEARQLIQDYLTALNRGELSLAKDRNS
jgi:hypothetical protein